MAMNTTVRARVDEETRDEAAAVLAAMGLKALPLAPNEETIEAMRAARRGGLVTVGHPDNLLADLNRKRKAPRCHG